VTIPPTGDLAASAGPGLAAVLFDMDGTLLDSEPLWDAALLGLAERLGGVLSDRARRAMIGRNSRETMVIFYQDLGLSGRDRRLDEAWVLDRMVELFATDLVWQPGAAELVAQVRAAGVPTALVTSTGRRLVEVALAGILGRGTFDEVVCGDEVAAPKPDPAPYLTAAARLQVPIDRCVAIEDSPTGLASAMSAGATVIGVRGGLPLPVLDGVRMVDSLIELTLAELTRLVA
jgi:HAD superfamily hydrolase (TIGR01509 family)